ncbi:MAG: hypothetical protein JW807_06365 [Spirochaetes bacterium]|nr:hypothetical protein [Spirochaetota bacterium]
MTLLLWRIDGELTGSSGVSSVYLQLAFSKARFENILASWRSGGLELFINTLWLNFLYAVSYSFLLTSVTLYFSRLVTPADTDSISGKDLVIASLPFAAGGCDWILHALYLVIFIGGCKDEALICAISAAAVLKWFLAVISVILLLRSYFAVRKEMKGRAGTRQQ